MVKANEPNWFPELRSNIKHPFLLKTVDWIAEASILHLTTGINNNVHVEDLIIEFEHNFKYKHDSALALEATALTTKCIFDHAGMTEWGAIGVYADIVARGIMKHGTKFTDSETVELIKNYEDRRVLDPGGLDFGGIALRGVFSRPMPDRMRAIDDFIIAIKPQVLHRPLFPWSKPNRSRPALERMVKTQGPLEHDLPEMNALRQLIGFPEFKPRPPIDPQQAAKVVRSQASAILDHCLNAIGSLAKEHPNHTFYGLCMNALLLQANSIESYTQSLREHAPAGYAEAYMANPSAFSEEENPAEWSFTLCNVGDTFIYLAELDNQYFHGKTSTENGQYYFDFMEKLIDDISKSEAVAQIKRTKKFKVFWMNDLD